MVIISRSQDKLQKVADEISELAASLCLSPPLPPPISYSPLPSVTAHIPEEKYGCEVRVIPVDFSEGHEIYPRIAEELQDLDIGVLGKTCNSFLKHLALLCG